jgi:general secretion pathway protein M
MNELKQALLTFWSERNQRERTMLIIAIAVVVAGLLYLLLINPAISGRRDLQKRLPALRQQAAELQAMAKETATLSGKTLPPAAAVTKESLEASLTRRGLKPQSVSLTGDLAKVQLSAASFANITAWLNEMQQTARLTVVEANVEALLQSDSVNATLTLRQQKGE